MSFSLGIFDLFSYLIPGMLYLYVINEFLKFIGLKYVDISQLGGASQSTSALVAVSILFTAFVIGHMFDFLATNLLYKILYRRDVPKAAIDMIRGKYKTLDIEFQPDDWDILMTILRARNIEITQGLDKFQADSIMLRNLALGFFMLMILETALFFQAQNLQNILFAIAALAAWGFASYRSRLFRLWFYIEIFQASLVYGSSLKEVVESSRSGTELLEIKKAPKTKVKSLDKKK